jgi:hypothetical protein
VPSKRLQAVVHVLMKVVPRFAFAPTVQPLSESVPPPVNVLEPVTVRELVLRYRVAPEATFAPLNVT